MSDYKHGEMSTTEQEKTYAGFIKGTIWLSGICIGILVFMAIFTS
ncbi:MAG: aa3-type cytochrome c oxidase subunit IV [Rhodobacteraceae bacterium]|nr:aa3-type cytochrome c oxidase subunit IV [Paracoccaceae bacterium]